MPINKEKRSFYHDIAPLRLTVEGHYGKKEVLAFRDKEGLVLTKEEVIEARKEFLKDIEKAAEFYAVPGMEEVIRKENIKKSIASLSFLIEFQKKENGKLMIPDANLKQLHFKTNLKRDWNFTCGGCGQKTSRKGNKHYYGIDFPCLPSLYHSAERACSVECGQHIWNEVLRNWIYENDYQDVFALHL
ncbi:hypothetical protein [Oceanobacillus jordanicus]|uniref:Uncharacterized protein n=1 Tax=Oceanobacillus jordanicus TaxID=2867266 RepID=A0AAW5B3M4_9BACI|nr:hypothetical protein [Oceanobacillus jordanicus]MCG3418184.1 hypothetical protein [Oceanobacillus jordanicus]